MPCRLGLQKLQRLIEKHTSTLTILQLKIALLCVYIASSLLHGWLDAMLLFLIWWRREVMQFYQTFCLASLWGRGQLVLLQRRHRLWLNKLGQFSTWLASWAHITVPFDCEHQRFFRKIKLLCPLLWRHIIVSSRGDLLADTELLRPTIQHFALFD